MQRVWTTIRPVTGKSEKDRQNEAFREAASNLGSFVTTQKRIFEAQKVEIISQKKMAVIIPGIMGSVEGFSLISQNISNPKPLNITVQRGNLKQDLVKENKLFLLGDGMVSVSGEKKFDPLEKIEKSKGAFQPLPVKDPDLTSVDGMEFRQTGTLQINIKQGALIVLR